MPRLLLSLALVAFAARAFCFSKEMQFDCGELGPGASQTYLQTFSAKSKFFTQLEIAIEARNNGTAESPKCHVKWTVSGKSGGRSRILFRHAEDPESSINGVSFEGTSPDGSKLLLDFFTAAGDHTGHRPVVYDFVTGHWQIRDVGNRVTRDLPSCDYFTFIGGVTDQGDVVLYVPKSIHVDAGCPDQGEWLLNMETDRITRLDKANAPSQTHSQR